MTIKAKKITPENFSKFGTILDPFNCGEPINPGTPFPYYNDRMPLKFGGGSLITLSVQFVERRPLKFNFTEAHDDTEELVGGFDKDVVFHAGPSDTNGPDFSKFEAFILPKYFWYRTKKGVYHECPFILEGDKTLGWCLLPPFTAYNDTREYHIDTPMEISI